MAKKEVISIRVSYDFKNKLESEAKMKEISVSELILETLDTPERIKEHYDVKIKKLEDELENSTIEKNILIENNKAKLKELEKKIVDSAEENKKLIETLQAEQRLFSEQQKLLSQQQQLQLFTQRQVEQLQQEKQLLIESESSKRWWKFWT